MKRTFLVVACCAVFILGCSTFDKWNYGKSKPGDPPKMSKKEMREEIKKLTADNQNLRAKANLLTKEKEKNKQLEMLAGRLKEKNRNILSEKQALEKKLSGMETEKKTMATKKADMEMLNDPSKIKIKVLSGDGAIKSALEASSELKQLGYQIKLVGLAPRPTFTKDTVFYMDNYKPAAEELVKIMGGGTRLKPLTWPSAYQIIVVTVKKGK